MLQHFDRPCETPEDVEIGGFGGQRGCQRHVRGLAIETGAANAGPGQKVRNRLHSVWKTY